MHLLLYFIKENVHLGWGMWNPIGFSLTVLIPIIMRGAMVEKHRTVYLIAGIVTCIFPGNITCVFPDTITVPV